VKELDFAVLHYNTNIEEIGETNPVKMEVGIEECLHI
jgi:hypothetical protein